MSALFLLQTPVSVFVLGFLLLQGDTMTVASLIKENISLRLACCLVQYHHSKKHVSMQVDTVLGKEVRGTS